MPKVWLGEFSCKFFLVLRILGGYHWITIQLARPFWFFGWDLSWNWYRKLFSEMSDVQLVCENRCLLTKWHQTKWNHEQNVILLMVQKSCTSWYVKYHIIFDGFYTSNRWLFGISSINSTMRPLFFVKNRCFLSPAPCILEGVAVTYRQELNIETAVRRLPKNDLEQHHADHWGLILHSW